MAFKDSVKQWFLEFSTPTWQQFHQKFEWLRWKDEQIQINEVAELQEKLSLLEQPISVFEFEKSFYFTLKSGCLLEWLFVIPTESAVITMTDDEQNHIFEFKAEDSNQLGHTVLIGAIDKCKKLQFTSTAPRTKVYIKLVKLL